MDASEAKVEVLEERLGTSLRKGLALDEVTVDVAIDREASRLLHSVCRLIVLQSIFSSRGPSPRQSAWLLFEKTVVEV